MNQLGPNGQTKRKSPYFPENQRKTRKPKETKTKKHVSNEKKPKNPKTKKPRKRKKTKTQEQIRTSEKTIITKKMKHKTTGKTMRAKVQNFTKNHKF